MVLLVTSASGINGAGYGKLLAFDQTGQLLGPFTEDTRISDPRGLGVEDGLLFSIVARIASWRSMVRARWYATAA